MKRRRFAALAAGLLALPAVVLAGVNDTKATILVADGLPQRMRSADGLASRIQVFHYVQGQKVEVSWTFYDAFAGVIEVNGREWRRDTWSVEWKRAIRPPSNCQIRVLDDLPPAARLQDHRSQIDGMALLTAVTADFVVVRKRSDDEIRNMVVVGGRQIGKTLTGPIHPGIQFELMEAVAYDADLGKLVALRDKSYRYQGRTDDTVDVVHFRVPEFVESGDYFVMDPEMWRHRRHTLKRQAFGRYYGMDSPESAAEALRFKHTGRPA